MSELSKHAVKAAGKCAAWMTADDDEIIEADVEAFSGFIQAAIDAATAELRAELNLYHRERQELRSIIGVESGDSIEHGLNLIDAAKRLRAENERLRQRVQEVELTLRIEVEEWAEDDNTVKLLAKPFIGDVDAKSPYFIGIVEVVEKLTQRMTEMEKLMDDLPHNTLIDKDRCWPDCPRCAWEKLKKRK